MIINENVLIYFVLIILIIFIIIIIIIAINRYNIIYIIIKNKNFLL